MVTQNRDNNGQLINMYHSSETNMDYPSKEEAEKADTEAAKKNKLTKKMAEASKNGDSIDDLINKHYNSANGTWSALYNALKANGADDKTIAGIVKSKGLTGAKAQEWLKNYEKNKSQSTNTDTKTNTGMSDEEKTKQLDLLNTKLQLLYERKAQSDLSNEDYAAIDTQINKLKAEIESLKTGQNVDPEQINPDLYKGGETQLKASFDKNVDTLIKEYEGTNGTWTAFEKGLRDLGYNDATIRQLVKDKGLDKKYAGAKAFVDNYDKNFNDNAKALGEVEFEKNQPVTKEALDAAKHKEYEDFKSESNKKVDDLANSTSEIDPTLPENNGTDTSNPPGTGNTNLTTGTGGKGDGGETDMDKFWKAFKAGAFRAYPMLQAIGDALSQQAKMTMDRANILTGKGSDLSVYEGKDPSEYFFNEDYEYRQAFLDAEAGNYEGVKELLLKGKVTLEQVAAALKLTDEDVEKIFGQEMRGREADTVSKELSNEKVLKDEIKDLHAQLTSVNECIHDLEGTDRDYYLDVLAKFMSIYEGRETVGTQNGTTTTKNDSVSGQADVGVDAKVLKAGGSISGDHAEGTTEARNASRNKDISFIKALPKGEEYARMALEDRDKANDNLMNSLLALKQKLLDQIAEAEAELKNIRTNQNAAQTGGKNTILIPSSKDMTTTPTETTPTDTTTTTDASGGNGNATEQPQQ